MQKVLYISIPMAGKDEKKQRATAKMYQRVYEADGFKVINPYDLGDDLEKDHLFKEIDPPTYEEYMVKDLVALDNCTHILFCDGWANSKGCVREADRALELKLTVMPRLAK